MKAFLAPPPPGNQLRLAAAIDEIRRPVEAEAVIVFGDRGCGDWVERVEDGYFSDHDRRLIVKNTVMVDKHDLRSTVEQGALGV